MADYDAILMLCRLQITDSKDDDMEKGYSPSEYSYADVPGAGLIDYAFTLIDEIGDADRVINILIEKLGISYGLDTILVREKLEEGWAMKCTYEWRADKKSISLNLERRFVEDSWSEFEAVYARSNENVYICNEGEEEESVFFSDMDGIKTLMQIPLRREGVFIGCVEFINSSCRREWTGAEVAVLKNLCRIMASYLFCMRTSGNKQGDKGSRLNCDTVTGLPKYEVFQKSLRKGMELQPDMGLVIVCSDITNFKYINEKYTYETGDMILAAYAKAVYASFSRVISCCREYSDNFLYAIRFNSNENDATIRFRVDKCNNNFIRELKKIIPDDNLVVNSGIYFVRSNGQEPDAAISNANIARKYAKNMKSTSKSRSVIFSPDMIEGIKRDTELVSQMDAALKNGEFKVYLQPKVLCSNFDIVGAEALIRWQKPDGRFIFPDEFIPAFERDGCIVKMDYYVYESVFKYIRSRLDAGKKVVPVSMNVSRVHLFNNSFIDYIEELMHKYGVPAEYLEFELTENIYIDDLPSVIYTFDKLKALNIGVSIDDFGSGYSSLDILTSLPINVIKLDRVFMKDVLEDNDKIIIACIIEMARKLGMHVLCEGVESEEQRRFLEESCCEMMQGYLFSKPIDIDSFNILLEK